MKRLLACLALLSICVAFSEIAFSQAPEPASAAASQPPAKGSFQELLNRLNDAIAGDLGNKVDDKKSHSEITLAAQLQRSLGRGEYDLANSTLARLLEAMPTPETEQIIRQLQLALPAYIEDQKNALAARVSALREKAARVCLEARKETDLDPLCGEIEAMRITSGSRLDPVQNAKLEATGKFLGQCQKYLAEHSSGYEEAALATLALAHRGPNAVSAAAPPEDYRANRFPRAIRSGRARQEDLEQAEHIG